MRWAEILSLVHYRGEMGHGSGLPLLLLGGRVCNLPARAEVTMRYHDGQGAALHPARDLGAMPMKGSRAETVLKLALELAAARQHGDNGEAMLTVLDRYLDEAELRGRNSVTTLTCVYCGHVYEPGTPSHGAAALTAHVKVCAKHPMSRFRRALESIAADERDPATAAYARGVLKEAEDSFK